MNKTEMWNAVVEQHPEFADGAFVLKQRARGLRRLIEQAWDEGYKAAPTPCPKPAPMDDIFNKFFKN